jgi:hypothetical protein
MPGEFTDIAIRELDEEESYRRSGGFWEKNFKLTTAPSPEWIALFNEAWDEAEFFPKRHARIENDRLIFVCLEEELNGDQMAGVIAAMNTANRAHHRPPRNGGSESADA